LSTKGPAAVAFAQHTGTTITAPLDNPTEPQYNGLMMIDLEITMDAAVIVFLVIAPFAMVYILADAIADRSE